jgi:hypothetical protein
VAPANPLLGALATVALAARRTWNPLSFLFGLTLPVLVLVGYLIWRRRPSAR